MTHKNMFRILGASAAATVLSAITGCSGMNTSTAPAIVPIAGVALQGNVHGGQQPVAGATIALYAAATSGYAGATSNLLTRSVVTDAGGNFSITGAYQCVAGQQMYLVATGGNPGGGTNPNLALMAPLGDCSLLLPTTFISMNEVTTVAGAIALAPFMTDITHVGTTPTNTSGLAHAFVSANKLVNIATGLAPGSALPSDAVAPTAEINTLADVMAACINSTGGRANDGTPCGNLFGLSTPANGVAPADTVQAMLNIAHAPTRNVAALFSISSPMSPFSPQLANAPADWTMAITYKAGGTLHAPRTTTVDAVGNVWVANSGNNTVTLLTQSGAPAAGSPFSGNGLTLPSAIAVDLGGNAWVANGGGQTVSIFTAAGNVYSGSPFAGAGTISGPSSIAIDAPGNVWIANKANSSVTELSSAGGFIQNVAQSIASPMDVAVNPK